MQKLNVGYVKLELIPRGVGKIQVKAPQLYYGIQKDQTVTASLDIFNEGSRRLDNIKIETDLPFNWQKQLNPQLIPSLEIDQEQKVQLTFTPPYDVSPGRYEVRVRTTALTDDQAVDGEDKTITVEILPDANIWGTLIVILMIIGVIFSIVIFGIKLTRR